MADGVPQGYHTVQPFLMVPKVGRHMDFLVAAFGATIIERVEQGEGHVLHGEVRIGDSVVMLGCAHGNEPTKSILYLYVPDVDAMYAQAVAAGGESKEEPADQFYGDRTAAITDSAGITWYLATRKETLSPEDIQKRMEEQRDGC